MMSLATIRELSAESGERAKRRGLQPYHPETIEDIGSGRMSIPFLGDYTPKGWTRTEESWFVDTSGFGQDDEPALSINQMIRRMKDDFSRNPTHAYALTEQGQFQGYVTVFDRV